VLLAAHNAAATLRPAVDSVLTQTLQDLELLVVDDCSTDETAAILESIDDTRLIVLRNDVQLGLAGSLNRGLDRARGRWIARLDADDIALPPRLEAQIARVDGSGLGVVGTAVIEIDAAGQRGARHEAPSSPPAVRGHTLFSSPFFHPTVLVDRELLDRERLRYDTEFLESEDYELWSRLLTHADGANLAQPLVLRRIHTGQASKRRSDLQRSFQKRVALSQIAALSPDLDPRAAELAWLVGSGLGAPHGSSEDAAEAFTGLLRVFERKLGRHREVRSAAAAALAREAARAGGATALRLARTALRIEPLLPLRVARRRLRRWVERSSA
jgi:hypothetical protein